MADVENNLRRINAAFIQMSGLHEEIRTSREANNRDNNRYRPHNNSTLNGENQGNYRSNRRVNFNDKGPDFRRPQSARGMH